MINNFNPCIEPSPAAGRNHYVKTVKWFAVSARRDRDNTLQEFLAPLSIPPEEKT
jgi:hypothetical protein